MKVLWRQSLDEVGRVKLYLDSLGRQLGVSHKNALKVIHVKAIPVCILIAKASKECTQDILAGFDQRGLPAGIIPDKEVDTRLERNTEITIATEVLQVELAHLRTIN